jgi:hypothetical protein
VRSGPGDGKRQITGLYVAGDFPDLQRLHLTVMDVGLATMMPCQLGFAHHVDIRAIGERRQRVAAALWRSKPSLTHQSPENG